MKICILVVAGLVLAGDLVGITVTQRVSLLNALTVVFCFGVGFLLRGRAERR